MASNIITLTRLLFSDIFVTWLNCEVIKWLFGFVLVAYVIKFVKSLLS